MNAVEILQSKINSLQDKMLDMKPYEIAKASEELMRFMKAHENLLQQNLKSQNKNLPLNLPPEHVYLHAA